MQFHERIRQAIKGNEKKVELFQWSAISGVSALIYSEYIRRIQRKTFPTPRAEVPTIHSVQEMLNSTNSQLCDMLSRDMIDIMVKHPLMERFGSIPELILFKPDNVEVLKCIFDAYVLPKIGTVVAGSIAKKFNLQNDKQQEIVQNREIDMFDRKPFTAEHIEFIANETVLQLLMLVPSISRDSTNPVDLQHIHLKKNDIITINNINALTPIYLDHRLLCCDNSIMDLIKFVTSTTSSPIVTPPAMDCDNPDHWELSVSPFNEVLVTTNMTLSVDPPEDTDVDHPGTDDMETPNP